jgi:DNA-binding LacI/PurR family transcriptional regulator
VSYVLNGLDGRISEHTRTRVLEAAKDLGYVANAMASALRSGRTEVVLLALPAWPLGSAVAEWATAGVAALERLGYTPLVHLRQGNESEGLTRACARVRPVGVIGPAEALTPRRVASLRDNGTQAILAISQEPLDHVATLVFDQALVGETALAHLIARGHRNIVALVPGEPHFAAISADRLRGARNVAASHRATLHVVEATCSVAAIGQALEPVLPAKPTALYTFNDDYALEAIEALEAAGHGVPDDVAVVGCDDSAAARRAKLTTIALGEPRRWELIAQRLHALVDGADDRTPIVGHPRLVPRETT